MSQNCIRVVSNCFKVVNFQVSWDFILNHTSWPDYAHHSPQCSNWNYEQQPRQQTHLGQAQLNGRKVTFWQELATILATKPPKPSKQWMEQNNDMNNLDNKTILLNMASTWSRMVTLTILTKLPWWHKQSWQQNCSSNMASTWSRMIKWTILTTKLLFKYGIWYSPGRRPPALEFLFGTCWKVFEIIIIQREVLLKSSL